MSSGNDDATQVKCNGWKRGSILPQTLVETLREEGDEFFNGSNSIFVVVSHDCDVTNNSFTLEPDVEIAKAEPIDGDRRDGNKAWGKSPRIYQLLTKMDDKELLLELNIHHLSKIPRDLLKSEGPDNRGPIDDKAMASIVNWIARRYTRDAFPDAFNERARKAVEPLRKKFKKGGHLLTGVYLLVEDRELGVSETYEIDIWGVMDDDDHEDVSARNEAAKLLNDMEEELALLDGIDVNLSELRREKDVSLSDIRKLKRWDFDDLTIRKGQQSSLPPTP